MSTPEPLSISIKPSTTGGILREEIIGFFAHDLYLWVNLKDPPKKIVNIVRKPEKTAGVEIMMRQMSGQLRMCFFPPFIEIEQTR
jgi:hypothetical protein